MHYFVIFVSLPEIRLKKICCSVIVTVKHVVLTVKTDFTNALSEDNSNVKNEAEECATPVTFLSSGLRVRLVSISQWRD